MACQDSGPILIYYDGYYPLANSIDVRNSVRPFVSYIVVRIRVLSSSVLLHGNVRFRTLFLGTFDFLSHFSLDLWVLSLSGLLPRVADAWCTVCDAL